MTRLSFITRVGKYFTYNMVPKNHEHQQNENMDLGFGNPEDNLVNSANTEFMPDIENTQLITSNDRNAQGIMHMLNGLSSQKFTKGNYEGNRILIIRYILPFINGVYDYNKNKEYSRGTIFALLALRDAIPNFEELITPQIKNSNGILVKFKQIWENANSQYIHELDDITNEEVISNFGFGQRYDLSEIKAECRETRDFLSTYLTEYDPYQINYKNQFRLPTIAEEPY